MKQIFIAICLFWFMASTSYAGLTVDLSAKWCEDIDGYVQTPTGGKPGTSSDERPTLEELGIEDVAIYDMKVAYDLNDNSEVYMGFQIISMDKTGVIGTIEQDLISQGVHIPANTPFKAKVKFNWYRLGYKYIFPFKYFKIAPKAELILLDFDYMLRLNDEEYKDASVFRDYSNGNLGVGVDAEVPITKNVKVLLECSSTVSKSPRIATAIAKIDWEFYNRGNMDMSVYTGVSRLYIDYEDHQEYPNHIWMETDLDYMVGFTITF